MPKYIHQCQNEECSEKIEFECKMSELDETRPKVCPKCSSTKIESISFGCGVSVNCGGFFGKHKAN